MTIAFGIDPKAAAATRGKIFSQAAQDGTPIGASHLAFSGLGGLRSAGEGYQWLPLNSTQTNPKQPAGASKSQ